MKKNNVQPSKKFGQKNSGSTSAQLKEIDETLGIAGKDRNGSCVEVFGAKWKELCEAYGYTGNVPLTFLSAEHPYPQPILPIKLMDKELYMTRHYASVAEWGKTQKRPRSFEVVEIKRYNIIGGIFISGPFNEYTLFQAFLSICTFTKTLSVLRLNNCSLKKESIMLLADVLPCTKVTHLYLDGNPVPDEDYSCILKDNTTLVHLSLALCKIGWRGLKALADVLGIYEGSRPNQCLKSLVLDNNKIDCLAMKYFAECLRWNKDLVFLSLAGNLIGNQGMKYLSKCFYLSELTRKEICTMNCRHIDRLRELEEIINEELNLPIVEVRNGEIDIFELENDCLNKLSDQNIIMAGIDRVRMHVLQKTCDEFLEMDPNPIVADVYLANGKFVSAGNSTLHSLNISFNKINQAGFMHMLRALREQKLAESTRGTSKKKHYLKLIEFMGNPCPEDSIILKKIVYYLKQSNLDKEDYHSKIEPCTCLPVRRTNLDRDTLLIIDKMVEYFKPKSRDVEESEESDIEMIEEFECCDELGEEDEEESISEEGDKSKEEESSEDETDSELAEILEDLRNDDIWNEEEIEEECKDSEDEEEEDETASHS